jgi:predicted translin family RNA/ssDNA-binding protein
MIIVQDTFVCKPGNASKLAKLFKETMGGEEEVLHVLTDMTGPYHRVIMSAKYENLAEYEKSFDKWSKKTPEQEEMNKKFANMNEMYTSGSREIFKVW